MQVRIGSQLFGDAHLDGGNLQLDLGKAHLPGFLQLEMILQTNTFTVSIDDFSNGTKHDLYPYVTGDDEELGNDVNEEELGNAIHCSDHKKNDDSCCHRLLNPMMIKDHMPM